MKAPTNFRAQRGIALIISMLLLLVVTIMAVAMFRSYGIADKIAGNLREQQRALHAAETAEQFAEYWLTSNGNASSTPAPCTVQLNGNLGFGQICSNELHATMLANGGSVTAPPWSIGGVPVGVTYVPYMPGALAMSVTNVQSGTSYNQTPLFYISDLGASPSGSGEVYEIDAAAWGAASNTVAVVEATYMVGSQVTNLGGL